jgi:predicted ribosomally synthesized peptide with SipW-like signal peptide
VRALLAGGLVLGLGATFTFAAWTDKAYVSSDFGTGTFGIQANVSSPFSSGGWAEYGTSAGAGTLTFSIPTTSVVPGVPTYAPVSLRTISGSIAALVTIEGATTTGSVSLGAALRYRVIQAATCNAAAFTGSPTYIVGSSTPVALTTGSAANAISLQADGANTAPNGTAYCFELSLPDTPANQLLQGLSATAVWQFTATS